jgi:isocitrate dehydrogenase
MGRRRSMRTKMWKEAAKMIEEGIAKTIQQKRVTYDLERLMTGGTKLGTSAFASAIIENMVGVAAGR